MKRIAFVTCAKQPNLYASDEHVIPLLTENNIEVETVPWNKPAKWDSFDLLVIRSAWDYPLYYNKFLLWLDSLEHLPVWNMTSTLRWNTSKTYLSTFSDHTISTAPTRIIIDNNSIPNSFDPWTRIVIKPSVGAWAYETKIFDAHSDRLWKTHVKRLLTKGPVIVQKYMEEITNGEYSCIFFEKVYSHAVLKVPKKGDFRVQSGYGGTVTAVQPPAEIITHAQRILNHIPEPLLYARVDGFMHKDSFILMEIELCEPDLFLNTDPHASKRFADAIIKRLLRHKTSLV